MLSDLSNLAKNIDGIIAGFITFMYSAASAVVLIAISPFRGSLRQYVRGRVSSSTMLFVTLALIIAYLTYGTEAAGELLNASSSGFLSYIVTVIGAYISFDVAARLLAYYTYKGHRRRQRAEALFRYSLAVGSFGWILVFLMFVNTDGFFAYFEDYLDAFVQIIGIGPENGFVYKWAVPGVFAFLVFAATSYPVFVTYFALAGNAAKRRRVSKTRARRIGRRISDVLAPVAAIVVANGLLIAFAAYTDESLFEPLPRCQSCCK